MARLLAVAIAGITSSALGWMVPVPSNACVLVRPDDTCPDEFSRPKRSRDIDREIEKRNDLPALTKAEVLASLEVAAPAVLACGRSVGATGSALVRIVIAGNGKVSIVIVEGKLDGTPLGACVERAVRGAPIQLRASLGLSLEYPFALGGKPGTAGRPAPAPTPVRATPAPAAQPPRAAPDSLPRNETSRRGPGSSPDSHQRP